MKLSCKICNKKYIDYLLHVCKCDLKMCSNCKNAHMKLCSFDYQKEHKEKLEKCLIKIQKKVIEKI